ncbi:tetratricopeptide repeat protein [Leptothoe sp. ISB3NOV94-8A]
MLMIDSSEAVQKNPTVEYRVKSISVKQDDAVTSITDEAEQLNRIGIALINQEKYSEALEKLLSSLALYRKINNLQGVGVLLSNIATVYEYQYKYEYALDVHIQALAILQEVDNRHGQRNTLNSIGFIFNRLGDYTNSLEFFKKALVIDQEIGELHNIGISLNNIGSAYHGLSDYSQALEFYNQSLEIRKKLNDLQGRAAVLNNIGTVYFEQSLYSRAIDFHQQSLAIRREIFDSYGIGESLNNIGLIFAVLGQYKRGVDISMEALEIQESVSNFRGMREALTNIGFMYSRQGQYENARLIYSRALEISQNIDDRRGEATLLNSLGLIYSRQGDDSKALSSYQKSLKIRREIKNPWGISETLHNIAAVYSRQGEYDKALELYNESLLIAQDISDLAGQGSTLGSIGSLFKEQNQVELGITFLKKAVTVYESIHGDLSVLDHGLQDSYKETVSATYRELADLLLQENRVLEAQAVLDLLRTQELEDYFQDVRSHDDAPRDVDYWQPEEEILTLYKEVLLAKEDLARLKAKADTEGYDSLTPDELELFDQLSAREGELLDNFTEFLEYPAVKAAIALLRTSTEGQNIELASLRTLQNNIANLPNAVLLYPLIFEDRLELILVPPDAPPIRRPVEVSAKDVNEAILNYRTLLRSPHGSTQQAKAAAQKLYNWLIKDIEEDLALLDNGTSTQTIVYSPDGALRYIPLVALHDGNQWLAERFSVTHITTDSISDFDTPPQTEHAILAAACADCSFSPTVGGEQYTFSDLSFTRTEVNNLAAQIPNTDVLLDVAFSKTDTKRRIELVGYNIIHLATHGAFVSSSPDESFILFGDGNVATLREMRSWPLRDADLVVLSACETGLGGQDLDSGIEVLGLGYQIQRAGAKAAMASLWRVDDGGTQALMNAFYLALSEGLPKAEALRRAQLALIKDDLSVISGESRAAINIVDFDTGEPISLNASSDHPYYWAPFILIGNGL